MPNHRVLKNNWLLGNLNRKPMTSIWCNQLLQTTNKLTENFSKIKPDKYTRQNRSIQILRSLWKGAWWLSPQRKYFEHRNLTFRDNKTMFPPSPFSTLRSPSINSNSNDRLLRPSLSNSLSLWKLNNFKPLINTAVKLHNRMCRKGPQWHKIQTGQIPVWIQDREY